MAQFTLSVVAEHAQPAEVGGGMSRKVIPLRAKRATSGGRPQSVSVKTGTDDAHGDFAEF